MAAEGNTDDDFGDEKDERSHETKRRHGGGHDHRAEGKTKIAAEGKDADILCTLPLRRGMMYEPRRLRVEHRRTRAAHRDCCAQRRERRHHARECHAAAREQQTERNQPRAVLTVGELPEDRLHH